MRAIPCSRASGQPWLTESIKMLMQPKRLRLTSQRTPHRAPQCLANQSHAAASRRLTRCWRVGIGLMVLTTGVTIWTSLAHAQNAPVQSQAPAAPVDTSKSPEAKPSQPAAAAAEPIKLPKNVAEMRDALVSAARSADVENLRVPYAWNELPPFISDDRVEDPIAYWKKISRDGKGLEILNILDKLLSLPPAKIHVGPDHENSALYVWPYLSELDLSTLTPRQQFELRTLVPPAAARKIMQEKKWSWWRLAIGADGTWHSFMEHTN